MRNLAVSCVPDQNHAFVAALDSQTCIWDVLLASSAHSGLCPSFCMSPHCFPRAVTTLLTAHPFWNPSSQTALRGIILFSSISWLLSHHQTLLFHLLRSQELGDTWVLLNAEINGECITSSKKQISCQQKPRWHNSEKNILESWQHGKKNLWYFSGYSSKQHFSD